ncbi:MAG: Glutamine--fructose-6-phosphate aminotransferase (isomerizing) [candidate division WS2 bacterium]|nr:Glutamine--fructose-6-phosphate aminotransferase (isomerizing) [Candidatus Lithacetigena glycinireducens]
MCGIIAYIGNKPVMPILIQGLQRLEYRGYDSAGIALVEEGELNIIKTKGTVDSLSDLLKESKNQAVYGIGHTRWATHGVPSDINAHPHASCNNKLTLVHNGIIENYKELREQLLNEGHKFISETDTEIVVHIIEKYYQGNLEEAVIKGIKDLQGAYALAIISAQEEKIVLVRKQSPLIIGVGEGECYAASDIPALLPYTKKIVILEEGDIAILEKNGFKVINTQGKERKVEVIETNWDARLAEKSGYPHFMLKEIYEQPTVLKDTLRERISEDQLLLDEADFGDLIPNLRKVYFGACGTAYHATLVGKHYLETLCDLEAETEVASEFRYRDVPWVKPAVGIIVSQSGETADTLGVLTRLKELSYPVIGITNVIGSSVSRESDRTIYTRAGPEISVASTKAYTSQMLVLLLLALSWAKKRNKLNYEKERYYIKELKELPFKAQQVIDKSEVFLETARELKEAKHLFYLGRLQDYYTAHEGALKMKEISYIHAEAYAGGELKHGPLALIENNTPVIAFLSNKAIAPKMLSNFEEVRSRGGKIYLFTTLDLKETSFRVVKLPDSDMLVSPILNGLVLQLLAYYTARECGAPIDKPRNLAKSVTVE